MATHWTGSFGDQPGPLAVEAGEWGDVRQCEALRGTAAFGCLLVAILAKLEAHRFPNAALGLALSSPDDE